MRLFHQTPYLYQSVVTWFRIVIVIFVNRLSVFFPQLVKERLSKCYLDWSKGVLSKFYAFIEGKVILVSNKNAFQ